MKGTRADANFRRKAQVLAASQSGTQASVKTIHDFPKVIYDVRTVVSTSILHFPALHMVLFLYREHAEIAMQYFCAAIKKCHHVLSKRLRHFTRTIFRLLPLISGWMVQSSVKKCLRYLGPVCDYCRRPENQELPDDTAEDEADDRPRNLGRVLSKE